MSFRAKILPPLTLALGFASTSAWALEPAAIKAGIFDIVPILTVDARYDDNVTSTNTNEVDSWVTVLTPSVQAIASNGTSEYAFSYTLVDGTYHSSHEDDFTDHFVTADTRWEFNQRNALELRGSFSDAHEARGTGFSQGAVANALNKPDQYREALLGGRYIFGSSESKGRFVFDVEQLDKEYTTNRDATRGRDRENLKLTGTFYWAVAPKTQLLFEVEQTDIDYTNDPAVVLGGVDTLDSELTRYFTGVTWEATAKTTGIIKLGYQDKAFDDPDRKDSSDFSWDASIAWSPKTYSTFTLATARNANETNGVGNFINAENVSVDWQHDWSETINTNIYIAHVHEDYVSSFTNRDDDSLAFGGSLNYEFRRWINFGVAYDYSDRDSSTESFNFDRNQFTVSVDISM